MEIVPAILKATYEGIEEDWLKIYKVAEHIQIDITDGVFAGDGSFRDVKRFKQLPQSEKIELHFMVHTPTNFLEGTIDLNPARVIFHIESFTGTKDLKLIYQQLRASTTAQLALAINPDTPISWLEENLKIIDYVLFLGYNPGWANQPLDENVLHKIGSFHGKYPDITIAVDGHVNKETIPRFIKVGATVFGANTSIFGSGDPVNNFQQLTQLAHEEIA